MNAMDNSVDYIRRNRGRFLRAKKTEPIELVERILGDALYAGASECAVLRQNDWWMIASPTDWLCGHAAYAPEELFHRIVAMPEAGQNAMRGSTHGLRSERHHGDSDSVHGDLRRGSHG